MKLIYNKYLLSALLLCTSIVSASTSEINPYEQYFNTITNRDDLYKMKDKLLDENSKSCEDKRKQLDDEHDRCDSIDDRIKITDRKIAVTDDKIKIDDKIRKAFWKRLDELYDLKYNNSIKTTNTFIDNYNKGLYDYNKSIKKYTNDYNEDWRKYDSMYDDTYHTDIYSTLDDTSIDVDYNLYENTFLNPTIQNAKPLNNWYNLSIDKRNDINLSNNNSKTLTCNSVDTISINPNISSTQVEKKDTNKKQSIDNKSKKQLSINKVIAVNTNSIPKDNKKIKENGNVTSNNYKSIKDFKNCKNQQELDNLKQTLLKDVEEKKEEINKKYESEVEKVEKEYNEKYNACSDFNKQYELWELKYKRQDQARKKCNELLEQNESRENEINEEYNKYFEILFCEKYKKILEQYNTGELKYNTNTSETLANNIFNKETNYYYSLNDVQMFIELQHSVQELVKNKEFSSNKLDETSIKKFFEIMTQLNNQQIDNVSMLYYQISLLVSNKKDSEQITNQTLDLSPLRYLLKFYNNNTKIFDQELCYIGSVESNLYSACTDYYINSRLSIKDCISKLKDGKNNILQEYNKKISSHIMNSIYDRQIKTYKNNKFLYEYYTNEKRKKLEELSIEKVTNENWSTIVKQLQDDKYLESFNIFVNAIINLYEITKK